MFSGDVHMWRKEQKSLLINSRSPAECGVVENDRPAMTALWGGPRFTVMAEHIFTSVSTSVMWG